MSSDTPAVSELVPGVPKIVITEPFPLLVEDASGRDPNRAITPTFSEPPATTPVTDPQPPDSAEDMVIPTPLNTSFAASEGFVPFEDSTEVQVEEDDVKLPTTDPGVAEQQVTGDDLGRRSFRDRVSACFQRCVVCIEPTDTKLDIFYALLLSVSIATGFMGGWHMEKCPLNKATPLFLFMMGVVGCMVGLCQMIIRVRKDSVRDGNNFSVLSTIAIFGKIAIVVLFITEMVSFVQLSPSFRPGDSNYCYRMFYNYTFWLNWCGLICMFLVAVAHAPKMCRRTAH